MLEVNEGNGYASHFSNNRTLPTIMQNVAFKEKVDIQLKGIEKGELIGLTSAELIVLGAKMRNVCEGEVIDQLMSHEPGNDIYCPRPITKDMLERGDALKLHYLLHLTNYTFTKPVVN